jgi:hypothetical protein
MSEKCTHTLSSGSTCKSPAVRGSKLCFNHTPNQTSRRKQRCEYEPFELPPLQNKSAVLVAISEVLYRLAMRRIKRSEADTLIHGLTVVARLMTEVDESTAESPMEIDMPAESEPICGSLQKTLDDLAAKHGLELPTLEEMMKLQASMPDKTAEQAVDYLLASGRIRPAQQGANGAKIYPLPPKK